MALLDKHDFLGNISKFQEISIELGCGNRKRNKGAIGIDVLDYPAVDIVGDVYEVLGAFPDMSVDRVQSHHFIEHVADVPGLLAELSRIVKPNGIVEFIAPHFSNPYFYSDPTHRSFFGLYTFCYYSSGSSFNRHVPTYGYKPEFQIEKVDLRFKSTPPFLGRHGIKRLIGFIFNSCTYMKELYEENFCYVFPCYEVRYVLRRNGDIS